MTRWQMWHPILRLAWHSREARRRLARIILRHTPALMLESAADLLVVGLGSLYALVGVGAVALITWNYLAH
jgi:hypothetical protein